MSITQEWIAWLGFMFGVFLVGLLWARKERRDRGPSSPLPRRHES